MHFPSHPGPTTVELSPAARPPWQALNLNLDRNLARLRALKIKSKITIKIRSNPFRLDSMAVPTPALSLWERENRSPVFDESKPGYSPLIVE